VERRALIFTFVLDADGNITKKSDGNDNVTIERGVVTNCAKLSYVGIQAFLDHKPLPDYHTPSDERIGDAKTSWIGLLKPLITKMEENNLKGGEWVYQLDAVELKLGRGKSDADRLKQRQRAQVEVEDLFATFPKWSNHYAAELAAKTHVPFISRVQPPVSED